jgi:hypothetical protein
MRVSQRQVALGVVSAVAAGGFALGGCGSSGSSQAVAKTCQSVSAVLSDGPDPDADPVGYAEAQILPLRQIHTSDKSLQDAIDALASAYQQFFSSNGSAASSAAVKRSAARVDAICPGATS